MKTVWTDRVTRATARYGENAPMATVCCNACRTCATTNIIGLVMASAGGLALGARRLTRRFR
ncbi:MAG: hypothetical protein ACJ744_04080 [Gaiellaceae bacterium]